MPEIIVCKSCGAKLEVEENIFLFPNVRSIEIGVCPNCKSVVIQKEMNGWFFVSLYDPHKREDKIVTYPMP